MVGHQQVGAVGGEATLAREVVASKGFSTPAVMFAVLASVVGAVVTAELGTGQVGRLTGAAIGPIVTATFTTWWSGGRGPVQLAVICALSALALFITVSGFFVADTVADEPVLGDGGSGSLVPWSSGSVTGGAPAAPGATETIETSGTDREGGADLAVTAISAEAGVDITVTNVAGAESGGFEITMNGLPVQSGTALPVGGSVGVTAPCPDPPAAELTVEVRLLDTELVDPDLSNNVSVPEGACPLL